MTDRELMQQALEALEMLSQQPIEMVLDYADNAIEVLRERLAQPEQSAWNPNDHYNDGFRDGFIAAHPEQERYTAPPQRKPLTDEGIEEICWTEVDQRLRSFARGSEAKLKEKNND